MKNKDVVTKILQYHPLFPENYSGCDNYKCGNPDEECTGVVTALVPTIEVIQKAIELHCNLLIVHEPTFYSTPDYAGWKADFANQVFEEKKELLEKNHITIWRDHDHMHAHQPDAIFTGVAKYLGWEEYINTQGSQIPSVYRFTIPECTVQELRDDLVSKLKLNGIRYLGIPDAKVKRVSIVGHLMPGFMGMDYMDENGYYVEYGTTIIRELEQNADVVIPGEITEWTVLSYVRDAIQLGKSKAIYNIGHFNLEELGMKFARDWIAELVGETLPVLYVPSGDMYRF